MQVVEIGKAHSGEVLAIRFDACDFTLNKRMPDVLAIQQACPYYGPTECACYAAGVPILRTYSMCLLYSRGA